MLALAARGSGALGEAARSAKALAVTSPRGAARSEISYKISRYVSSTGYFKAFTLRGAPVRFHWTTPIGALLVSRGDFAPGIWLGYILIILIHEAGHAALVRRTGHEVVAINVHAVGGNCQWEGSPTRFDSALIAWGGVWAQAALLVVAASYLRLVGAPTSPFLAEMVGTFIGLNIWIAAFNLIPLWPLDGAEAWKLIGLLRHRLRERRAERRDAEIKRAREGAKLRLSIVEEARKQTRAIAVMDEVDDLESGVTPEVEAVLERARAIAAEEGAREALARADKTRRSS